jgi:hypothetical protein
MNKKNVKSKAIPVTGRGGLQVCEMLKNPHCLVSRLTDGGKVVSPKHRPRSTPQKHYFSVSSTHFCYSLSKPWGLVLSKGLGELKTFIYLIRSRTRDLPACSVVPLSLHYLVQKEILGNYYMNLWKFLHFQSKFVAYSPGFHCFCNG